MSVVQSSGCFGSGRVSMNRGSAMDFVNELGLRYEVRENMDSRADSEETVGMRAVWMADDEGL